MIYRILGHCVLHGRRKEIGTLQNVAKTSVFLRFVMREVAFLNFGFFEFLKIISRGRYSTSDDSASIFRGKRKTFNTSDGKSPRAMVRSRKLCSQQLQNGESLAKLLCFQLCNFHFWRKSRHNCCMFVSSTPIFLASALQVSYMFISQTGRWIR